MKIKRKSKTQKEKKKQVRKQQSITAQVTGRKISTSPSESMGRINAAAIRAKWLIRLGQFLRNNIRMLVVWALVIGSVLVLWQFSAHTSGSFSSDDEYEIAFDHTPDLKEIKPLLDKHKLKAISPEIKGGNILVFTAKPNDSARSAFVTEAQGLSGVLNAQAYVRRGVKLSELYQVKLVIAGVTATLVSAAFVYYNYRKRLQHGVKAFMTFWVLTIVAGLSLAALGVGVSQLSVAWDLPLKLRLTAETFNLYIIVLLSFILFVIYALADRKMRGHVVKLLFK